MNQEAINEALKLISQAREKLKHLIASVEIYCQYDRLLEEDTMSLLDQAVDKLTKCST